MAQSIRNLRVVEDSGLASAEVEDVVIAGLSGGGEGGATAPSEPADGSVTAAKLADGAVTNPKLVSGAVSPAKLAGYDAGTGHGKTVQVKADGSGFDFVTPATISSVKVSGLPAGATPTAGLAGGVLTLGIPAGAAGAKGDPGDKGETGAPGVTSVKVNGLNAGVAPTAALTDGVLTLGIPAGPAGAKGETGAAGAKGADGKSVTALSLTADASGKVTGGTITFSDKTTAAVTVTTATA